MKRLRLQHGFVLSEEDVSKEDADKMWKRAMEIYEENKDEIEDSKNELANGGGVLWDDLKKELKL